MARQACSLVIVGRAGWLLPGGDPGQDVVKSASNEDKIHICMKARDLRGLQHSMDGDDMGAMLNPVAAEYAGQAQDH